MERKRVKKLNMAKWKSLRLIVILLIMTSCKTSVTKLHVDTVLLLNDFPSGSSLEYHNNRLYLTGDDALRLLILDTNYNRVDSITLFEGDESRIPKAIKADLEASAIIIYNSQPHLLLIGSASLPTREKLILIPLNDTAKPEMQSTSAFFKRLPATGVKEVNIEGAATAGNLLVMGNRGNLSNPVNQLIFTDANFWLQQQNAAVDTTIISWPKTQTFTGISSLSYIEANDLLLFAASTELTGSSYNDGNIGDSYLGWVKDFSSKVGQKKIEADGFINLTGIDKVFDKEKIESVCISHSQGNTHTIHMVSDNDNGFTRLFKATLIID